MRQVGNGMHALLVKLGAASLSASEDDVDSINVVAITLFVSLLCLCIVIGHLLEEIQWVNESITTIILGCIMGVVVLFGSGGTDSHVLKFNDEAFFIYLLPPIIFNAGFQVKKKQFFHNFVPIILFGIVGAFMSFGIIASGCAWLFPELGLTTLTLKDYLALGIIFSATDSVCVLQVLHQDEMPLLYSLVFGEGIVNDATSVVLYRAVQEFELDNLSCLYILLDFSKLLLLSTTLGILVGLVCAYITKILYFGRHAIDREIAFMALMAYLSYTIAELFSLSGILAVFFCGIVMSHYTWHNVTECSRITTKYAFATVSSICEACIFLYVGMDVLDIEKWKQTNASVGNAFAVLATLISLIFIARAAFVFPLSALSNYLCGDRINMKNQAVIWWAGLTRGAVSIALTFNQFKISCDSENHEHATMIATTTIVVLLTTVVFGVVSKPFIYWILPRNAYSGMSDMSTLPSAMDTGLQAPFLSEDGISHKLANAHNAHAPSIVLRYGSIKTVHHIWRLFDDKCMHPIFGGRGLMPFYSEQQSHHQKRQQPQQKQGQEEEKAAAQQEKGESKA